MKDIVIDSITEKQIEIQAIERLQRILEDIPIVHNADVFKVKNDNIDIMAHANIGLHTKIQIICEVKKRSEPLYIRSNINKLNSYKKQLEKENSDKYYCMIAAPYVTKASSEILDTAGIGYIDLSGNCLIKHRSIYVRIEGKPNKYVNKRGNKSIFERSAIKSGMILRNLLEKPERKWKMQELADTSFASIGQVFKVKKYLEEREWITTDSDGFSIRSPKEIINEWAKVYNSKPNDILECYSLDKIPEIEQKLFVMKKAKGIEYALTGYSGGVRYAPAIRYTKVHVYIPQQDLYEACSFLGCKEVAGGSNVTIIVPYDQSVLYDMRIIENSFVASPVQVCLDLLGLGGRGEDEAEAIMNKEFPFK